MPSSMLTSMTLAPPRTWSTATCAASAQLPALISRAKRAEPVTFVRSPTLWKKGGGAWAAGNALGFFDNRGDLIGGRAATAADDVHEAAVGKVADQRGGFL